MLGKGMVVEKEGVGSNFVPQEDYIQDMLGFLEKGQLGDDCMQ
jgi:hypothetical protein